MKAGSIEQRLDNIEQMLNQLLSAFAVSAPSVDGVSVAEEQRIRALARENMRIKAMQREEKKRAA